MQEMETQEITATDTELQFVSFQIGKEKFAFPMQSVGEIIRVPVMVGVPLGPHQMMGLANLRGNVLPVYDLRAILLSCSAEQTETSRVVVVESTLGMTGFLVDKVNRVYSVPKDTVVNDKQGDSSISYDYLQGLIKQKNEPLEQILNVENLVQSQLTVSHKKDGSGLQLQQNRTGSQDINSEAEDDLQQLVCFSIAGQEFAFYLHDVGEIVRVPDDISALPDSNPSVLGLVNLRGRIIPIVDLAMNLGMKPCEMNDATRIIIVNCSDSSQSAVGFVVAKVSNVVSISPSALEPVPSMCNDGYTDGALEAVYRVEGTKRLISIVNLHSVFQRSLSQALSQVDLQDEVSDMANQDEGVLTEEDYAQYVIFSIAGQEYGVSIEDTQEITRIPDKLESVPNTPDYLQGIVNLRGTVLPVIDLRTRLGLPKAEATDRQRIVVLTRNKQKTGFIVDGVAEVKTVITDSIEDAPSLSDEQTELLNKLIKLNKEQRIIQLIEPSVLLNDNDIAKVNGG